MRVMEYLALALLALPTRIVLAHYTRKANIRQASVGQRWWFVDKHLHSFAAVPGTWYNLAALGRRQRRPDRMTS
jgi:hypothetical protein